MKPVIEWDENYLFTILPATEFSQLEIKGTKFIDYKLAGASDIVNQDVSKAISAMANSGGGSSFVD